MSETLRSRNRSRDEKTSTKQRYCQYELPDYSLCGKPVKPPNRYLCDFHLKKAAGREGDRSPIHCFVPKM